MNMTAARPGAARRSRATHPTGTATSCRASGGWRYAAHVRHPLGLEYVGAPKVDPVATACRRANPYCAATPHTLRFGRLVMQTSERMQHERAPNL
jgi:hypothetical protein